MIFIAGKGYENGSILALMKMDIHWILKIYETIISDYKCQQIWNEIASYEARRAERSKIKR